MRRLQWGVIATAMLAASILACRGGVDRGPTAPSVANPSGALLSDGAQSGVVAWACGAVAGRDPASTGGWIIDRHPCAVPAAGLPDGTANPLFSPAPTNLQSIVNGSTVQLSWDQQPIANDWVIEVGSGPGQTNLASFRVTRPFVNVAAPMTLVVSGVPAGTYFVRVRSAPPNYSDVSVSSNEIVVVVGGGGCVAPPAAPAGLTSATTGFQVRLDWIVGAGSAPSSFVVEAGSFPGATNIVVFDTGNPATTLGATAPAGAYFVRVRARNACGTSGPSNEVLVIVPSTSSSSTSSSSSTTTTIGGGGGSSSTTSSSTTSSSTTSSTSTSSTSTSTTSTVVPPPVAVITGPNTCAVQTTCSFSGSNSTGQISQWNWDFGDNTTGSGVSVSHVYPTSFVPQQFSSRIATVTLTVIGPGGQGTTTKDVTITRTY